MHGTGQSTDEGGDAVNGSPRSAGSDGRDEDERLVTLLRDLVGDDRKMKTAAFLGVSYRTLDRALDTGVLLPRIRDALKRRELEAGGEAGLRHRARVEELERRADALDERVAALEQAQEAAAGSTTAALGELTRGLEDGSASVEALASRLARIEAGGRGNLGGPAGSGTSESAPVVGRGVVTLDAHAGEAESYGEALAVLPIEVV